MDEPNGPIRLPMVEEDEPEAPGSVDAVRPRTRAECTNGPRPCPWVGCRMNTYLDVDRRTGRVALSRPGEPDEVPADTSCALDLAERGGMSLSEVGDVLGVVRERVRQIEEEALTKVRLRSNLGELASGLGAWPW